jgi:hypothetical protein
MYFLKELTFDWMDMLNFFERPFRAKFIPSKIWDDLDKYKNDSTGLCNYSKKWRTKIEWKERKTNKKQKYIAVGGEYDSQSRQCIVQIYTNNFNTVKFTTASWDRFKFKYIQVLMHEIIHFMQYDRRGDEWSNYVLPYKKVKQNKKNEERKYLSEFDEIQAYAHCILLDFKTNKPNTPTSELISRSKTCKTDSTTLQYILKVFDYDYRNNQAIPKLMQQIGKWERKYDRKIRACRRPK